MGATARGSTCNIFKGAARAAKVLVILAGDRHTIPRLESWRLDCCCCLVVWGRARYRSSTLCHHGELFGQNRLAASVCTSASVKMVGVRANVGKGINSRLHWSPFCSLHQTIPYKLSTSDGRTSRSTSKDVTSSTCAEVSHMCLLICSGDNR